MSIERPAGLRRRAVAAIAVVAAGCFAADATASPETIPVSGSVISPACAEASTGDYNPATQQFQCDAIQRFDGGWTGTGHFHATGTVDPLSGDATGRFTDLLNVSLSNGQSGTVDLAGTLSVSGSTGKEKLLGTITGGSGVLRGATGTVRMRAFCPLTGGPAQGSYWSRWRP